LAMDCESPHRAAAPVLEDPTGAYALNQRDLAWCVLAVENPIIFDQALPRRIAEDIPSRLKVLKGQFEQLPFVGLNHQEQW
jgi:hypothetical protein